MKIFVTPNFNDSFPVFLFREELNFVKPEIYLFEDLDLFNYSDFGFQIVPKVEDSDYVVISSNISSRDGEMGDYLKKWIDFSKYNQKPLIIFAGGDLNHNLHIPEADIVFKNSIYSFTKKDNEYVIPSFVEDLGRQKELSFLKKIKTPTIGFCGWANTNDIKLKIKFLFKNFLIDFVSLLIDKKFRALKKGLYFRKKVINKIRKSNYLKSNFIIRSSFSANLKTIELSPEKAREEFIQNISESHFSLAIKGDGNHSNRFYEILSLGRIPILIDTESVMPLEDKIDYSKFCLRVDFREINKIDQIIFDFYKNLSNEQFINMQKLAREAFDKYLKADVFFRNFFTDLKSQKNLLSDKPNLK